MDEYIIVDLSPLISKMGNVIIGVNIEYAIIKYYRMLVVDNYNTVDLVNNYICNYLHHTDNNKYTYDDVTDMVKEKYYNTAIFKFIGYLEQILLNEVDPYVTDIIYDNVVDKENLLVRFKLVR